MLNECHEVFVPLSLIFPKEVTKLKLLNETPEDFFVPSLDSGYMNCDLFQLWQNQNIEFIKLLKKTCSIDF